MGCAGVVGPRDKPREVMTFEPAQVEEDKKWLFDMSKCPVLVLAYADCRSVLDVDVIPVVFTYWVMKNVSHGED